MEENNNTRMLIGYVLTNQSDRAISILESNDYDKSVLADIEMTIGKLPLWLVTKLNSIILEEDGWETNYLEKIIIPSRKECRKLYSYFRDVMGFPMDEEVDFGDFPNERGHFKEWNLEDLLDAPLDTLVFKGYNADECLLCYAVLVGDLDLINEQIAKGTNPNVYIDGLSKPEKAKEAYHSDSYNALLDCGGFVSDAFMYYGLGNWWELGLEGKGNFNFNEREFNALIEAAFYNVIGKKLDSLAE